MTMEQDTKPNLTPRAQQALKFAKDVALSVGNTSVTAEHLLISLLSQTGGILYEIVASSALDAEGLKKHMLTVRNKKTPAATACKFHEEINVVIAYAHEAGLEFDHTYVGVEHLFLGILRLAKNTILEAFGALDLSAKEIGAEIKLYFTNAEAFHDSPALEVGTPKTAYEHLEKYAVNYNLLALEDKFGNLIGKEKELMQLAEVLCCQTKNNPLLLGDPGVGKTALIEGLAQKIVNGEAADFLLPCVIYGLDLSAMVAGTKYRGQFEERLKNVIKEVRNSSSIILFIDEFHTLIGAGSAEGSMDAANILKPLLARGELRCIGATTFKEYKKHIQKDGALSRRFHPITITEPSTDEAFKILRGAAARYEKFHGVKYKNGTVRLAVDLADRYINTSALPDKAFDVLDQAGSKCKIQSFKRPPKAKVLENKINLLMNKPDSVEAFKVKEDPEELFAAYKELMAEWSEQIELSTAYVTPAHLYEVVSEKIGAPLGRLTQSSRQKLLTLKDNLSRHVIGQGEPLELLVNAILRNKMGLNDPSRPLGSFLFLGPTGTGKTYLAKMVAQEVFGDAGNLIQIDMSEYADKTSASKLIGAAPGYVGYEEAGQLTERIRKQPYSVVLFDEIDKAHPDTILLLLQVLEEGRMTDNLGVDANFKNALIIATGNFGTEVLAKRTLSFGDAEESRDSKKREVLREAKKFFTPEFINRLDEVVIFNELPLPKLKKICKLELTALCERVHKEGVEFSFSGAVVGFLATKALQEEMGCRPLRRLIQQHLETPIAHKLLENADLKKISAGLKNKQIYIK
mgnify:CR=1 FL=1